MDSECFGILIQAPNHFIKTDFIDKNGDMLSSGRVHVKSWHFVIDDNSIKNGGVLSDEYIESLKKATPSGMFYDRDIRGLWVSAEGMIYLDFDYSKHTCSVNDITNIKFKEYFAGVDWGWEHHGIIGIYGIDHDGKAYRLEETAKRMMDIDDWVKQGQAYNAKYKTKMLFYCDDARPDNMQKFRQGGLNVRAANKSVVEGISYVASQFKQDRLVIVRETNPNYMTEVYNYRWKENTAKEEPIKELDDSMDTERYALYSHNRKNKINFY